MTSTGVNMSPEQLQELVASLTTAAMQAVSAASASGTAVAGGTMLRRSFSEATVTFSGARDAAQVEEFLAAASIFKKIHNISDADAIMCMPLILKGEASTWWQSVKSGVETWAEFEQRLRHAFAPRKPAYMVYQEVFAKSQPAEVLTEVFVASNRALLAQLPAPGHTEQQQLDMIYRQQRNRRLYPRVASTNADTDSPEPVSTSILSNLKPCVLRTGSRTLTYGEREDLI
ncbi:Retrotransposon protein [Operophtera brumata]|uniref:Retrotransposon protein n=1 Tax=Operophtera brumata TaxID=104452 RepID=A0A0L7L9I9_OPEBR|nr:Retrotransposon protein [Operophtera brumata]